MTILLADDKPFLVEILDRALTSAGHLVRTARDGCSALQACKDEKFDLVITDRWMPQMDGLTLAQELKSRNPSQRVVLLTGLAGGAVLPPYVDHGLTKPIRIEELMASLKVVAL